MPNKRITVILNVYCVCCMETSCYTPGRVTDRRHLLQKQSSLHDVQPLVLFRCFRVEGASRCRRPSASPFMLVYRTREESEGSHARPQRAAAVLSNHRREGGRPGTAPRVPPANGAARGGACEQHVHFVTT